MVPGEGGIALEVDVVDLRRGGRHVVAGDPAARFAVAVHDVAQFSVHPVAHPTAVAPTGDPGTGTPSPVVHAGILARRAPGHAPGRPCRSCSAGTVKMPVGLDEDLLERLAAEVGHLDPIHGVADREHHERSLVLRATQDRPQEHHG